MTRESSGSPRPASAAATKRARAASSSGRRSLLDRSRGVLLRHSRAGDEDRQPAGLGAGDPAGHGGVEDPGAGLVEARALLAYGVWSDRAHQHPGRRRQRVRVERGVDDGRELLGSGDHDDGELRMRAGQVGGAEAGRLGARSGGFAGLDGDDVVAAARDPQRHREPDGAGEVITQVGVGGILASLFSADSAFPLVLA